MYYCVIVAFCQHEHAMICYIRFNRALTTLFYLVPRCQVSRFQSPSKKNTVRHGKKQPNLLSLSFFMFYLLFVLFNLDIILAYFFCFSPCVLALFTVFAFSGDFIIILLKTSFFFFIHNVYYMCDVCSICSSSSSIVVVVDLYSAPCSASNAQIVLIAVRKDKFSNPI